MTKLVKTVQKGLTFYYQEDDRFIGQRIALGKYEPYLTKLMLEQLKEGDRAIDVGANIGYDTVLFAKKVGKQGKVYAFEPNETNFLILLKNIKANGLTNVVPVKAGLGASDSVSELFESEENYGDHRMFGKRKAQAKIQVQVLSLDSYLSKFKEDEKINMVKIDTQGYEPQVIEGMRKTIEKNLPTIFFEYWPWAYREAGFNKEKMLEHLGRRYGDVNFIDEYIQVYYGVNQEKLREKIRETDEDAAANLWVCGRKDWKFYWGSIKDFWLKKMVKRILGRPAT